MAEDEMMRSHVQSPTDLLAASGQSYVIDLAFVNSCRPRCKRKGGTFATRVLSIAILGAGTHSFAGASASSYLCD